MRSQDDYLVQCIQHFHHTTAKSGSWQVHNKLCTLGYISARQNNGGSRRRCGRQTLLLPKSSRQRRSPRVTTHQKVSMHEFPERVDRLLQAFQV